MQDILDLSGSILSFVGGIFLTWDALRVRRTIQTETGALRFREVLREAGVAEVLRDPTGRTMNSETDLRLWLSRWPLTRTWIGFLLMTVGFLLEIVGRIMAPL